MLSCLPEARGLQAALLQVPLPQDPGFHNDGGFSRALGRQVAVRLKGLNTQAIRLGLVQNLSGSKNMGRQRAVGRRVSLCR